MESNLLTK